MLLLGKFDNFAAQFGDGVELRFVKFVETLVRLAFVLGAVDYWLGGRGKGCFRGVRTRVPALYPHYWVVWLLKEVLQLLLLLILLLLNSRALFLLKAHRPGLIRYLISEFPRAPRVGRALLPVHGLSLERPRVPRAGAVEARRLFV